MIEVDIIQMFYTMLNHFSKFKRKHNCIQQRAKAYWSGKKSMFT